MIMVYRTTMAGLGWRRWRSWGVPRVSQARPRPSCESAGDERVLRESLVPGGEWLLSSKLGEGGLEPIAVRRFTEVDDTLKRNLSPNALVRARWRTSRGGVKPGWIAAHECLWTLTPLGQLRLMRDERALCECCAFWLRWRIQRARRREKEYAH